MVGVLAALSIGLAVLGAYSLLASPGELPIVEACAYFAVSILAGIAARETYVGRRGLRSGGRTRDARQD